MRKMTSRNYKKLPEVVNKNKEEEKRAELIARRNKMKEFDKQRSRAMMRK
jgi:hypothetical protein